MRALIALALVVVAVSTVTGDASAEPAGADLILYDGVVLTMDPARPLAQAIAIRGEHIVAVGSNRAVLRGRERATRVVDLHGRTVLPGFNDSHAHWIGDRSIAGIETPHEAISRALEGGWTSISELFVDQGRLDELVALDASGDLRLRVNAYLPVNFHDDKFGLWFGSYTPRQEFSSKLRIAGAKLFVDRADPKQMLLSAPHSDQPGFYGHASWTQQELTDVVTELDDLGWQVAIHTAGDGAQDLVLNAFETALAGRSNARLRHRVEHAMVLRDDQIRRIARLGLIASFQLTFFNSDWLADSFWSGYEPALGPLRIGWAGRSRDLLNAGVRSIGGTDTPWYGEEGAAASALEAVELAVTRVGPAGIPPRPWMLSQRISVLQALRLLTSNAAYGTFDEDVKGTLTPGTYADLVVLARNPLVVPREAIGDIDILVTMVGGSAEYCAASAAALCP